MSEDYQPNATGLMTPLAASQLGEQQSSKAIEIGQTNASQGAEIQQRIAQTKIMQQQLQQKMQDNHLAMQDHIFDSMDGLLGMDSSSPLFKLKAQEIAKNAQSFGVALTPDFLKALGGDDDQAASFRAAVGKRRSLDPDSRSQAGSDIAKIVGSEKATQLGTEADKTVAGYMQARSKGTSVEDSISKQVSGINEKFMTGNQYLDTAKNIAVGLQNGTYKTGQAENELKLAAARASQGGVPRSTQLNMMTSNRSWADKVDGYLQKAETGATLQPDELKDMTKILGNIQGESEKNRLKLLQPIHNRVINGGMTKENIFSSDDLNKIQDYNDQQNNPKPSSPSQSESISIPTFKQYKVGDNPEGDNRLKVGISAGGTLQQINSTLKRYKMKISQDEFNKLKGAQ